MNGIQEISVDIMDSKIYSDIVVTQYNSTSSIRITLTKFGEPLVQSPLGAMFTMRKPDGHTIINACTMSGNVATVAITAQMTVIPGKIPFQLVLYSGTNVLSTINGILTVIKGVMENPNIESTDEYTVLQQITYYATLAESYAVGGTDTRTGEDTDNAKYYYQLSRNTTTGLKPMGTVTFAQLIAIASPNVNDMYNVSNSFVSTSAFKDGSGITDPAGSNVYYTSDGKWDVLGGKVVTGVKGSAESDYRNGNVEITKANIGLPYAINVIRSTTQPSSAADIWVRPY